MPMRKTRKADLHARRHIYAEIGLIISLGLLVLAFRLDWNPESEFEIVMPDQEIVELDDIPPTKVPDQPPPPPKPPVPVEVPDDEVLEDEDLNLDAFLDLDEPSVVSSTPPPPPPKEEKKEEPEPEIFVIVEQFPEIIGGMASIQSKLNYPEIAKKAGVEGRVILQFVVLEDGTVDPATVQVMRGIGAGCDEEAVRAVKQAKFVPGKQRGKPVKVRFSIPITFKLK